VVAPVDVPDVSEGLVRRLIDGFRRTGAPVVVPEAEGKHGHPVALRPRGLRRAAGRIDLPEGARTVVHRHAAELLEIPVERLPADLDTPEEYRRWREGA
jgi:molybdenum cofactor cytidylyltransferase